MNKFLKLFLIFILVIPGLVFSQVVPGDVIINEFSVNASGKEFVELLVIKPGGVDMRGLRLSDVGTKAGAGGSTEGHLDFPDVSYLQNVPQGTRVVCVLLTPADSANAYTQDLDPSDKKLVLFTKAIPDGVLDTVRVLDLSTNENIVLLAGPLSTSVTIDYVATGTNTSIGGFTDAVWTANLRTSASNAVNYFTNSTGGGFDNNDTTKWVQNDILTNATPGAINLGQTAPTPPTYNVTFKLNTSTRLDTIVPTSMVQIRGNTLPLTWNDLSPLMTNIGGDYWEVTHAFPEGTNLEVQYFATDWEGVGNTALTVTQDTVLPLRYYQRGFNNPPYTPSDSVDVWFRVNVAGVIGFDPATQVVGIRGSFAPFDWGSSYLLTREGTSMFYSGVAKFHPDSARNVIYKFYIENGAGWEPSGDNMFPMKNDTTIVWKWFGGLRPTDKPITEKDITFRANIFSIYNNGFNPATDSLKILIFSGQPILEGKQKMQENPDTVGLFETTLKIKAALDSEIKYKFKAYPDERFDNGGGYETGSDRIYVWTGQDSVLPVAFPTIIPKATGLPHDVMIKFVIDMRNPVDFRTSQAITNLRDVWIKGGAAPIGAWQGNWTYDDTTAGTLIKLYDDGTNGDETAGDKFYSRDILWLAGTPGGTFEFKFAAGYPGVELGGAYYLDNEAGYATNHSWAFPNPPPTSARLRMVFGVMGPVSVRDINGAIPENYSLSQNYPNPFNPTTKIDFSIPVSGLVTLKVYNILGQEVATLMNGEMKAGNYRVDFSTDNLSSGTYFYKLTAGSFTSVKKMLLLR
ncbi:MAG: T9SS type A sorting domain-containing protein [Bacteroidota bacterium]|nr:T9SS type A sorting domain-containing protein [Bacteroidota bacterium]